MANFKRSVDFYNSYGLENRKGSGKVAESLRWDGRRE